MRQSRCMIQAPPPPQKKKKKKEKKSNEWFKNNKFISAAFHVFDHDLYDTSIHLGLFKEMPYGMTQQ